MTTIVARFRDGDREYVKVAIQNCCQRELLFEVRAGGFYDLSRMEMAPKGTADSIRLALKNYQDAQ